MDRVRVGRRGRRFRMGMDMMNAADGGDRRGSRLAATETARRAAIGRSRGYGSRGQR